MIDLDHYLGDFSVASHQQPSQRNNSPSDKKSMKMNKTIIKTGERGRWFVLGNFPFLYSR